MKYQMKKYTACDFMHCKSTIQKHTIRTLYPRKIFVSSNSYPVICIQKLGLGLGTGHIICVHGITIVVSYWNC